MWRLFSHDIHVSIQICSTDLQVFEPVLMTAAFDWLFMIGFSVNLMDADTLGPIILVTPEPASYSEHTKRSARSHISPFKKSRSPSPSLKKKSRDKGRKASKKKKDKSSSVFESFGVHSVEELLGGASDKENTDESEIPTEPVESRKRRKDYSTSQIVTEIPSRASLQRQVSYTDDFEGSISERIGQDKGRGSWARKVSVSSIPTQYSDEETGVDYTEDFASETLSVARDSDTDRSSHYRYSDEETEASETLRLEDFFTCFIFKSLNLFPTFCFHAYCWHVRRRN